MILGAVLGVCSDACVTKMLSSNTHSDAQNAFGYISNTLLIGASPVALIMTVETFKTIGCVCFYFRICQNPILSIVFTQF